MDGSLGSENGPILYNEPNRTSAIDDIRSVVIYIFIIAIFFSFFLILPGIRNDKFPTFLCITTSLFVASIIIISLFGTTWHVGESPISAAYKAFSRDRIQGELSVNIGLQSVNITLRAHKYYILHDQQGPMIMYNVNIIPTQQQEAATSTPSQPITTTTSKSNHLLPHSKANSEEADEEADAEASLSVGRAPSAGSGGLAGELAAGRTTDGASVDTELEVEEVFPDSNKELPASRRTRSSSKSAPRSIRDNSSIRKSSSTSSVESKRTTPRNDTLTTTTKKPLITASGLNRSPVKFTIERVNVDINYNERFYFIEPNQMRQEHQSALERGLPYPILTVVEYLSQDEAGFSWSRQYRAAGYYSHIMLCLSFCVCILMFFLHCAAPKYGIYTMQLLGLLLLLTNFTYATLVPKGDRKLVIPFEGQSLTFHYGWNFWLVLIGGLTSLFVGTVIVIIDWLFPNFIFTTILDVDFDSHHKYYKHRPQHRHSNNNVAKATNNEGLSSTGSSGSGSSISQHRPKRPPFFEHNNSKVTSITSSLVPSTSSSSSSLSSSTTTSLASGGRRYRSTKAAMYTSEEVESGGHSRSDKRNSSSNNNNNVHLKQLFSADPLKEKQLSTIRGDSEKLSSTMTSATQEEERPQQQQQQQVEKQIDVDHQRHYYDDESRIARRKTSTTTITGKNVNLKSTHQRAASRQTDKLGDVVDGGAGDDDHLSHL